MSTSDTPHGTDPAQPQTYLSEGDSATLRLHSKIRSEILSQGSIPFSRFMELALYDESAGYYSSSMSPRTGKSGDFFTSVSIGPLFGRLLAHRIHNYWLEMRKPDELHLIEAGAHDGTLMRDIFAGAASDFSCDFTDSLKMHLIEASPTLREKHPQGSSSYHSPEDLPTFHSPAAFFSNELYDAFPVDCLEFTESGWMERRVSYEDENFIWSTQDVSAPHLLKLIERIGNDYTPGTLAEARNGIEDFVSTLHSKIPQALFITIDYGFSRNYLYHKDRIAGTLSAYQQHKRIDNPLQTPGELDLTTHVDFCQLKEAHEACDHQLRPLYLQSSYLTQLAKPLLLQLEKNNQVSASFIRQFQSLSHPGILGRSFQVLEAQS